MPTIGVQEILVNQERARVERLSRDAWQYDQPTAKHSRRWRRVLDRPNVSDRA